MKPAPFDYHAASSVAAALDLFDGIAGAAKYIAGGQSLGPAINLRLTQIDALIDLSRIPELQGITSTRDGIRIGSAVRHAQIEDASEVDGALGLMRRVAGTLAYRAVRNRGTVGGSLAHADPVAEWPTIMTALGATIHTVSRTGRRAIPIADFLVTHLTTALAEDEIVTAIELPAWQAGTRFGFRKFCRKAGEFAQAMAVAILPPAGPATIVIGCASGTPIPLTKAAAATTRAWSPGVESELRHAIAEDFATMALTLDDYETNLHTVTAVRAVREAIGA